jgi:hypothetical protein
MQLPTRAVLAAASFFVALAGSSCQGVRPAARPAMNPGPEATAAVTVIRTYPSALLPPVADPYLFYWDFGPGPDCAGCVANAQGATEASGPALVARGRLPIYWSYGPQWPEGKSREQFIRYYLHVIEPFRAYMVDEWQKPGPGVSRDDPLSFLNPFGIAGAIEGIRAAKKRSPGSLVLIAWRGEDSLLPLVRSGDVDFLLIEAYSHLPRTVPLRWAIDVPGVDARIAKARSWGAIERTIPWLGQIHAAQLYHAGRILDAAELERQIRHYRQVAPEMPGVAFFGNTNPPLADAADALCRKYFVDLAPSVRIEDPPAGAVLGRGRHTVTIAAWGQGGREISSYRGFIDNRLVYEGSGRMFSWDFTREAAGAHYLTVHAIDGEWNRSAAQIKVEVRPSP